MYFVSLYEHFHTIMCKFLALRLQLLYSRQQNNIPVPSFSMQWVTLRPALSVDEMKQICILQAKENTQ